MTVIPASIIAAAQKAQVKWKVPASVSIAQWALESGWGAKSPGNNPFGIKHMPGYGEQHFLTHEVVNGKRITIEQTFAKFDSIAEAFDCHAKLIATRPVYAPAMALLPDLFRFVAAMGMHYATDLDYAHKIMQIINGSNHLAQYDRPAVTK